VRCRERWTPVVPDLLVFPDAEAVVIDYLDDQLDGDVPVSLTIPTTRPDEFVTVQRSGGPRLNMVADRPVLLVECWAQGATRAKAIAEEARALITAMRGQVIGGVTIYHVNDAAGPSYLPDPSSTQPRYTFTVEVAMRGTGITTGS
jgi:hypothetical protein